MSVELWPSSLAVISVSSCKSWSTHGLKSVLVRALEVVSGSRLFTRMKLITRHRITARTGVRTDRRAMTGGVQRRGCEHLVVRVSQLSADLMLWNTTDMWGGPIGCTLNHSYLCEKCPISFQLSWKKAAYIDCEWVLSWRGVHCFRSTDPGQGKWHGHQVIRKSTT